MRRRAIEYKIVSGEYPNGFGDRVTEFLQKGWQLYGDCFANQGARYNQALIKQEETECSLES